MFLLQLWLQIHLLLVDDIKISGISRMAALSCWICPTQQTGEVTVRSRFYPRRLPLFGTGMDHNQEPWR
jgi:hypothetical protein